ncbi:MAG: MotA/TolQ/ExbB proton channel family protein [Verrucomicrobia bacterium]|nr:MotA/TolQ/ExbB proton channel family protein [Verrucomicrobiota bacterium]
MESLLPAFFISPSILATGGLFYIITMSTAAGKAVMLVLFLLSIISWSVMLTKFKQVHVAQKSGNDFLRALRAEEHFVEIFRKGRAWRDCPLYELYVTGCADVQKNAGMGDKTKLALLESALERAVAEQVVRLESQVSILGTAVGTAPFLGLLGTVWGVMDAFAGVALAGSATIGALAPGISAALITTVIGLIVALPSMVGYNILVAHIRRLTMEMENFASEFVSIARREMGQ